MRKKRNLMLAANVLIAVSLVLAGCRAPLGGIRGAADSESRSLSSGNWNAARYGDTLDIGTKIRHYDNNSAARAKQDADIAAKAAIAFASEPAADGEEGDSGFTFDGGTKLFLGYDNQEGYYFKEYTLRSLGQSVEVWVANDIAFPAGDERPTPVITQSEVDSLAAEFDSNIYPKDTEFFGTPDSHTGAASQLVELGYVEPGYYEPADGVERTIMLVDNFRDEQYYDPAYPFFIAGFYTTSYEAYFDRNVISIDTKDWATRLENTFFPTTAHELQHLIHDDNDSAEETWINEGMSDYAEYVCGYGHPDKHINFFLDHPENSLVEWDDHYSAATGPETLADYGQAYLLTLYLSDQFGSEFIRDLAVSKLHGMESVETELKAIGQNISFAEIFRRFSLALAVDSCEPGHGIYQFKSIDVKVNFESAKTYDKDGVPAWGADYKVLGNAKNIRGVKIDGVEYMPTPWKTVADPANAANTALWGNEGNEIAKRMILELDLTGLSSATLSFKTLYDIEEQWDFGVVQVTEDAGTTWTSLANADTRSDVVDEGYPAIKASLPGFTGASAGWVDESFDLSAYAGKKIHLSFTYMTDWGSNGAGWYIDDVAIPELGIALDGSSLEPFMSYQALKNQKVTYQVNFVNEMKWGPNSLYRVHSPNPFSVNEDDTAVLRDMFKQGTNYMVTWYAAPVGEKGIAAFEYELLNGKPHSKPPRKPWWPRWPWKIARR
jgi:hypothetical protein